LLEAVVSQPDPWWGTTILGERALSLVDDRRQESAAGFVLYQACRTSVVHRSSANMDSRRLTVFPRTGNGLDNARSAGRNGDARPPQAPKRKVQSGNEPADPKLPKLAPTLRVKRKTFTPIDRDPEQHYRCIHSVDPEGERPYCLAQEIASDAAEHAYRVVMIRRSPDKPVVDRIVARSRALCVAISKNRSFCGRRVARLHVGTGRAAELQRAAHPSRHGCKAEPLP
jgi:hypothetical protein